MTEETLRERLVRVETTLEHLSAKLDQLLDRISPMSTADTGKSVVLPVAVVVGAIEVFKELVVRMSG